MALRERLAEFATRAADAGRAIPAQAGKAAGQASRFALENPGQAATIGAGAGALGTAALSGDSFEDLGDGQVVTHPETGERAVYFPETGQAIRESQVEPEAFEQLVSAIGDPDQSVQRREEGMSGGLRALLGAAGAGAIGATPLGRAGLKAAGRGVASGARGAVEGVKDLGSRAQGIRAVAGEAFDPESDRVGKTSSIIEALRRGFAADREAQAARRATS